MNEIESASQTIEDIINTYASVRGQISWVAVIDLVANEVSNAIRERHFGYAVALTEELETTLIINES